MCTGTRLHCTLTRACTQLHTRPLDHGPGRQQPHPPLTATTPTQVLVQGKQSKGGCGQPLGEGGSWLSLAQAQPWAVQIERQQPTQCLPFPEQDGPGPRSQRIRVSILLTLRCYGNKRSRGPHNENDRPRARPAAAAAPVRAEASATGPCLQGSFTLYSVSLPLICYRSLASSCSVKAGGDQATSWLHNREQVAGHLCALSEQRDALTSH